MGFLESRLLQAIEDPTGAEADIEEGTERAVEIIVRSGLTNDAQAFAGCKPKIPGDFDGIDRDDFAFPVLFFHQHLDASGIKAGVHDGKDKATIAFQELTERGQEGIDG